MSDRTDTIKPARIDLGDGDSLNLYRMSDYTTVVRFHGNNPNVQLSSAQVSTVALRAALDKVAPGSNSPIASPDYADGGVTAAAIEKEAERVELADDPDYWHAKFCEARQERDELRQTRRRLLGKVDQLEVKLRDIEGPEPRPLDSEVADEEWLDARYEAALDQVGGDKATHLDPMTIFMIGAKWDRQYAEPRPLTADDITDEMIDRTYAWWEGNSLATRAGMRAMLAAALTEPTRPEGAEDVESQIEAWDQEYGDDAIMTAPRLRALADYLAERGVRVATEEEARHATDE